MELTFRTADAHELDALVALRLEVLRAANQLPEDTPLPEVAEATRAYCRAALASGDCVVLLAYADGQLAGTGAVCFYRVLPTCDHPTGEKAYIMSMYTRPAFRSRGVARQTLARLVALARERGVTAISLEATAMGRPLYAQCGFLPMPNEMALPLDAQVEKI